MLSDEMSSRMKQVKTYPNKDQFRCLSVSHCSNCVNIYMDKLLVLCIVQYCTLNISFYVYMKCTYFDNQWFFNKYMFLKILLRFVFFLITLTVSLQGAVKWTHTFIFTSGLSIVIIVVLCFLSKQHYHCCKTWLRVHFVLYDLLF